MAIGGTRRRVRQRASQRGAINRPRMAPDTAGTDTDATPARPAQPERRDWPAIEPKHPGWWRVSRVERVRGQLRYVPIAEAETETLAMSIALMQASQCRVCRANDRRPPWLSFKQPLERDG